LGVVGLLISLLCVRLVKIQVVSGAELLASVERQHKSRSVIPARRGMILDRSGRVVAASRQMPDVFIDPVLVDDLDSLSIEVGIRVNVSPSEVRQAVLRRADSRYVVVARCVGEVEAEAIRELKHPAVGLSERSLRTYPLGSSMAHVLGFVGRDGNGLEGIELTLDEHLRGCNGTRATIRDARRRALWREERASTPPVDGGHVVLTIDAEIQRITEAALTRTIEKFRAKSGVGIVMKPGTGEVLAMACYPAFDVNDAPNVDQAIRRNRAVTDPVEPGSTFKPFITGGALAGGFVSPTERIDCGQGRYYAGRRLIEDTSPHGMMTLQEIVCKSSNIGMAHIGQRMGAEALHEVMARFGFGRRTGIECPGEDAGLLHPLARWTSYSVTSVPMGYEVGVTPLQLLSAFSAISNDGLLLRPRIVKELLGPDGRPIGSDRGPELVRRVLPSEVARYMSEIVLVSVVEEGSGKLAKVPGHQVLGKTGTSKLSFTDKRGYEEGAYLASFIAAAPASDPRVAVLVMVRRPDAKLGYYGSKVSAPAVGEILAGTLAYLQVPPGEEVAMRAP